MAEISNMINGKACVLTTGKYFKDFCKYHKIGNGKAEVLVNAWFKEKNTNTYSYLDPEFNRFIEKRFYKDAVTYGPKLMVLWNRLSNIIYDSEEDANTACTSIKNNMASVIQLTNAELEKYHVEQVSEKGWRVIMPKPNGQIDTAIHNFEKSGYKKRTVYNVKNSDFTIAAFEKKSAGEVATINSDPKKVIQVPIKAADVLDDDYFMNLADSIISKTSGIVKELDSMADGYTVNIAGNGLYTLLSKEGSSHFKTQADVDLYIYKLLKALTLKGFPIETVISGGQTGFDEAGIIAGKELGLLTNVTAPNNWDYRIMDVNGKHIDMGFHAVGNDTMDKAKARFSERFNRNLISGTPQVTVEDHSKEQEDNNPNKLSRALEKASETLNRAKRFSDDYVSFDSDSHTYTLYRSREDKVLGKDGIVVHCTASGYSDYINGVAKTHSGQNAATLLGTKVDTLFRQYFSRDPEEKNKALEYINSHRDSVGGIQNIFNDLVQKLSDKFAINGKPAVLNKDFLIDTSTFYMIGQVVNENGDTILIGGSPDMIVINIDGEGRAHTHMLDMKTGVLSLDSETDYTKEKLASYDVQQNIYKSIYNTNFAMNDESKIEDDMQLIDIAVARPKNLDSITTEKELEDAIDNNDVRIINLRGLKEVHVKTDEEVFQKGYNISSLNANAFIVTEEERESMVNYVEDQELNELCRSVEFTKQELNYVAKNIMIMVSDELDKIARDPQKMNEIYNRIMGTTDNPIDFSKVSRDNLAKVKKLVPAVLAIVYRKIFNPKYYTETANATLILSKLEILRSHWKSLLKLGYPEIIKLEGVSAFESIDSMDLIEDLGDNESLEKALEGQLSGEKQLESWQVELYQISARGSLLKGVKRRIEKMFILNTAGKKVLDKYGYGFIDRVNANEASDLMLQWFKNALSLEEMKAVLTKMSIAYPWTKQILEALDSDEQFASQFYQSFRKDFIKYSITVPSYNSDGTFSYVTKIINALGPEKGLIEDAVNMYNSGKIPFLSLDPTNPEENATFIDSKWNNFKKSIADFKIYVKDDLDRSRNNRMMVEYSNNTLESLARILQTVGVHLDAEALKTALFEDITKSNNSTMSAVQSLLGTLMEKLENSKKRNKNPMYNSRGDFNIYQTLNSIIKSLTKNLPSEVQSSVYEDGKMFYSYVTPSYMGKQMIELSDGLANQFDNIRSVNGSYLDFLDKRYGKHKWFKSDGRWINTWLSKFTSSEGRRALDYKTELSFNKLNYASMGNTSYALSLMTEYFYNLHNEVEKNPEIISPKKAYFRVPTMSNKPAGEFIGNNTMSISEIKKGMHNVFLQEIMRIVDVLECGGNDDANNPIQRVAVYDIDWNSGDLKKNTELRNKLKRWTASAEGKLDDKDALTADDMKAFSKSGANFKFLSFLNDEIQQNTDFGKGILKLINTKSTLLDASNLYDQFDEAFDTFMEKRVNHEINEWNKEGLFEHEETVNQYTHEKEIRYSHLEFLSEGYQNANVRKETLILDRLKDYIWNDMFATINIIQLTVTDLAYFKDMGDFQKRFALVHSPGLRLNIDATFNKVKISDGINRSLYVDDVVLKSECKENIKTALQEYLDKVPESEKSDARKLIAVILHGFDSINITDGEAYCCPASYRKKAVMAGKWDNTYEEAYNRILDGNYNLDDLMIICQPLKPFVASYESINRGTKLGDLKVPVQHKNSEFMLFLADALLRGSSLKGKSKIETIFDFMNSTHYDKNNVYRNDGIDTIQFVSAVKNGASGIISLSSDDSDEIRNTLEKSVYMNNNGNNREYNSMYVHSTSYEDYCIQQEVPSHFFDSDDMIDGTQFRMLSVSDLSDSPDYSITVRSAEGENVLTKKAFLKEYQNLIAMNIEESYKDLRNRLNLSGDIIQQNIAISKMIQDSILRDQKYGPDLLRACSLDKNGMFVVALSDPIQSTRVMQLLNSIIKSRINRQRKHGGPLVQVSNFGYTDELSIRWYKKNTESGKQELLETYDEYCKNNNFDKKESSSEGAYSEYCKENQGKLAYFEAYMPVPTSELAEKLTIRNADNTGSRYMTIDEAIAAGIFKSKDDEMLKGLGYRIPTEDKYSMLPIVIKGFVPKAAGEAIILPSEITAMSGSDFDIDKLYVILKNFNKRNPAIKKHIWKGIQEDALAEYAVEEMKKMQGAKDFSREEQGKKAWEILNNLKNNKEILNAVKSARKAYEKTRNFEDIKEDSNDEYSNLKSIVYKNLKKKIQENKGDIEGMFDNGGFYEVTDLNSKKGRDNRVFDLQWAVLTDNDVADKLFNQGSFEEQKSVAYMASAIKGYRSGLIDLGSINALLSEKDKIKNGAAVTNKELYSKLESVSPKKVKDLLETSDINILFPSTQVYYHDQNMSGKILIGIFANHIVSHAAISMENSMTDNPENKIVLNIPPNQSFILNGKLISNNILDEIVGQNGKRISKTIAGFLAASADIAKSPSLNYMNVNSVTANVAMFLARLGFNTDTIGLFLSQPILEKLYLEYSKVSDEGYTTIERIVDSLSENLIGAAKTTYDTVIKDASSLSLSNADLIEGLTDNEVTSEKQAEILALFKNLNSMATDLSSLTYLTKFNSITNAAGPTIADTYIIQDKVTKFISRARNGKTYFNEAAANCIENSPIIKSFYEATVGPTGIATKLFSNHFPQASPAFVSMIQMLSDKLRSNLNVKTLNKVINEFFYYCLTYETGYKVHGNPTGKAVFDGSFARRKELLDFPDRFNKFILDHPSLKDNPIIEKFKVRALPGTNLNVLDTKLGGLDSEEQEELKSAWGDLILSKDKDISDFGKELFYYSTFRNGLSYSPMTPLHLSSVDVKLSIEGYNSTLTDMQQIMSHIDNDLINNFFIQLFRNHSDDYSLVPVIKKLPGGFIKDPNSNRWTVRGKSAALKDLMTFNSVGISVPIAAIKTNSGKLLIADSKILYTDNDAVITYQEFSPLGKLYNILEYNAGESGTEMKTVVKNRPIQTAAATTANQVNDGEASKDDKNRENSIEKSNNDKVLEIVNNWLTDHPNTKESLQVSQVSAKTDKDTWETVRDAFIKYYTDKYSSDQLEKFKNTLNKTINSFCK